MREFKVLKFMDRFRGVFEKFNIDYDIMRKILQIKLTMDERRSSTMTGQDNKEGDKNFRKMLIIYAIMGVFIGIVMTNSFNIMLKMSLVFSIILFMMLSIMIADYSSVLLDLRDKNILLPRPIDIKTINAAKIMHIIIYMLSITLALSSTSMIAGLIKHGFLFFIVFSIELLFILGFTIFLTSILYFFILSVCDGEKVRDIVNYFQIGFSIIMMVGYQFMGNIFNMVSSNTSFVPKWWYYAIPPMWFAAPTSIVAEKGYNVYYIYFFVISVAIPILLFSIYFKFISPYFEEKLQKMNTVENRKNDNAQKKEERRRKILSIFVRDKKENAFLRFSQNVMSKERTFKLRLYPNLAFAVFMPFIIIIRDLISSYNSNRGFFGNFSSGRQHLTIYISVLMIAHFICMLKNSESYKGAWIYKVLPLENPYIFCKASVKAYVLKYIIPIQFFISAIFLTICGTRIILDLILIFLNLLLVIVLIFKISDKYMPFSKEFNKSNSENVSSFVLSISITGVLGVFHYTLYYVNYAILVYILISFIANIVLWKKVFS